VSPRGALPARGRRVGRVGETSRGRIGSRSAALALAALTLALALSGCETTQEQSAKLEKTAKHFALSHRGLTIAHVSTQVHVLGATVMHDSEGAAAAVTVSNVSAHALRSVPLAITVRSASGQTVYQNNAPGLEAGLTSISSLPAHGTVTWVDDQVPASGGPASVSAIAGEAQAASGPEPRIEVQGLHLAEAATGEASGTVRNRSIVAQQHLVVYVVARRGGTIVAAGRAVLAEVAAGASGASVPFQVFLVGTPAGARLEASAPASTPG
jgi:hypothetical protein